jgi:hypothetical protein
MNNSSATRFVPILMLLGALLINTSAAAEALPDPTSDEFCKAVQRILADTEIEATNTIFDNMPDYRASKPSPNPLMIYQVVTYDGAMPIEVSCKVKTADHLRAEYGDDAAGEQVYCPEVTRRIKAQAIAELEIEDPEAAARARSFVVEETEPYLMGSQYLADFELSFVGEDGNIHLPAPGLQTDWENWLIWIMPNRVRGQTYCHLPTVAYLKGLANGAIEPGTIITTVDDAPTTPAIN